MQDAKLGETIRESQSGTNDSETRRGICFAPQSAAKSAKPEVNNTIPINLELL